MRSTRVTSRQWTAGHSRRELTGLNFPGRGADLVAQATFRLCESALRAGPPPAGRPRRPHGRFRPQLMRAVCQPESSGLRLSSPTALKEIPEALPEPQRSVPPLDSRPAASGAPNSLEPRCRCRPRVPLRRHRHPRMALRHPPTRHSLIAPRNANTRIARRTYSQSHSAVTGFGSGAPTPPAAAPVPTEPGIVPSTGPRAPGR